MNVDLTDMEIGVTDVSVRFGGLTALKGVSLRVPSGQVVGLIGPNGAGKTTLFNAISGFAPIDAGRVNLGGHDVTRMPPYRRVSLGLTRTFQHAGLVPHANALGNVIMAQHATLRAGAARALLGLGRREDREVVDRAMDALCQVGVEEVATTPVGALSHGRRKLVELACAVARQPRVLLLDEPSAGLDRAETENLARRLIDIQTKTGCTTLVIDHDLRLVRQLAPQIVVVSFGEVIATGAWDDIRTDPRVVSAYLGPQTMTEELTPSVPS